MVEGRPGIPANDPFGRVIGSPAPGLEGDSTTRDGGLRKAGGGVKVFQTRKLTDGPHLNLFRTDYRDRAGRRRSWVFASRGPAAKIQHGDFGRPDAVVIVPFHVGRGRLAVIREFRVAVGGYQFGFPAGLVDVGESVAEACARELREETGLVMLRLLRQSPPIYSSSGMTDESITLAYVECDGEPTAEHNESSEDIQVDFLDPVEAATLCGASDLKLDAKAWIVLDAYARHGVL